MSSPRARWQAGPDARADATRAKRVLITGSEGVIGRIVRNSLLQTYDVTFMDKRADPSDTHGGDITDLASIQPAFVDIDAVVHLAAVSTVDAAWDDVLASNLIGTYNVFEAARRAGVRRVVFASSNHATGMYEAEAAPAIYDLADERTINTTTPVRPDSLYGVSKVFGEALGRMYADRYGMDVVCLRFGTVLADDDPTRTVDGRPFPSFPELTAEQARHRLRATWLSHRDCAQLVQRALDAPVHWAVVFGVSNNLRRIWDLEGARRLLGYEPMDSAPE